MNASLVSVPAPRRSRTRSAAELARRRIARPIALALALIQLAGLLTDLVGATQIVTLAGPSALSLIVPISGLAMAATVLFQYGLLDRLPRLRALRLVGGGYALALILTVGLLLAGWAPVLTTAATWLLADQLSLVLPVLLWAIAGDCFNTAEAGRTYSWMLMWGYGGQILGIAVAVAAPALFGHWQVPLPALLLVDPLACAVAALWVPRALRSAPVHPGSRTAANPVVALRGALDFSARVPVWREILMMATLVAAAGATASVGFTVSAGAAIGGDAGQLQTYLGTANLVTLALCGLYQLTLAGSVNSRFGVAAQLMVLPATTVIAGLMLTLGTELDSLWVLAFGIVLIGVPEWTVDDTARHGALSVVPDQLRARLSLTMDFGRFAVAQVVGGLLALIASLTHNYWLTGLFAAALAAAGLRRARRVRSGWDDSLLNWRLRRRKHPNVPEM